MYLTPIITGTLLLQKVREMFGGFGKMHYLCG